jgi:hypothetical protein
VPSKTRMTKQIPMEFHRGISFWKFLWEFLWEFPRRKCSKVHGLVVLEYSKMPLGLHKVGTYSSRWAISNKSRV